MDEHASKTMVSIVAHLTTNCRVRHLRISVPLISRGDRNVAELTALGRPDGG
jgi:hypothetical protein